MTMLTLRFVGCSFRLPLRRVAVNVALSLVVSTLIACGLFGGTYPVAFADVILAMSGNADAVTQMIVMEYRLPRLLTALGVGLAFGLAGELVQTLLRNPLASPDIIGFTAGAGAGALFTVAVLGSTALLVPGALLGGLCAAALVVGLSWRRGISPGHIVLIGIGITLTLSVISDLLMTGLDATSAFELMKWLVGSLHSRSFADVQIIWGGLLVLAPLALWHQFTLSRASLDEPVALSLGIALNRSRMITLGLSVGLVAMAVSAAGPLPFVAFVSGPIAHGLNRDSRPTLLSAALVGAFITLVADFASQSLPGGLNLPAGVFSALIGAPVLIWVLILQSRKQRL